MGIIIKNKVIYSGGGGSGAEEIQPVIYSKEEREIGVWIDGKPLYQKTWILQSRTPITNDYTTYLINDISVYNIDNIVWSEVYDNNDSSASLERIWVLMPIQLFVGGGTHLIAYYHQNNVLQATAFTLQYTKTTDTAGSGIWVPSGVPAVHYSEDEQVIGTWVDGKALYEKSFIITESSEVVINSSAGHSIAGFTNEYVAQVAPTIDKLTNAFIQNNMSAASNIISPWFIRIKQTNGYIYPTDNATIGTINYRVYPDAVITIQYTKTTP